MSKQEYYYPNESFSGCDMVATILMPDIDGRGRKAYSIGEIQTISYSIHMDRRPVRAISNINAKDYVMGPRTIAGSLVFTVFSRHFTKKIIEDINSSIKPKYAYLADELPPFDVIVSAANEYGIRSRMVIYGIRLVNEGQVMSINDIYTENTYQYVATDIEYLDNENDYVVSNRGRNSAKYYINNNDGIENKYLINGPIIKPNLSTSLGKTIIKAEQQTLINKNEKAIVDIWTIPNKRDGKIIIDKINSDERLIIDVAENVKPNNRISISLSEAKYLIKWTDEKISSDIMPFNVLAREEKREKNYPAPLIDKVTDNRIDITSNSLEHTHVMYGVKDKEKFLIKMSGFSAIIENLKEDTLYTIATCRADMSNPSQDTTVRTMSIGYSEFNDLMEFIMLNKKELKCELKYYTESIICAKDINEKMLLSNVQLSVNNTVTLFKEELSNLKSVDFTNEQEYELARKELNKKIEAALDIISMLSKISNDRIYGFNYSTKVVNPPQILYRNIGLNCFSVDNTISKLDFYRKLSKTNQFVKSITSGNFYSDNESILCNFLTTDNNSYFTEAVNEYGYKSSKVYFYAYDNAEKSNLIQQSKKYNDEISYKINKYQYLLGNSIDENLDNNTKRRLIVETIKDSSRAYVKPPEIEIIDGTSIIFKLEDNIDELIKNKALLVISELEDSLISIPKYKKVIVDNSMKFTMLNDGLRDDCNYIAYIENNEQEQISKSTTFTLLNNNLVNDNQNEKINELNKKNIVDVIINKLNEKKLNDLTIKRIIELAINDESLNKSNIDIGIFNNISKNLGILDNAFSVIEAVFEAIVSYYYDLDEMFFNEPVKISNEEVITDKECTATIIYISPDNVEKKIIYGKKVEIDNSIPFQLIIYSDNTLKKSGVIAINNYNFKIITYKLKNEVKI